MIRFFKSATIVSLAVGLLAGQIGSVEAKGSYRFNASEGAIKQACAGGTFLGKNKDGFYGCITDGAVTTCKKGKCVSDKTRITPTGDGNGGRPTGGNAGNSSGGGKGPDGGDNGNTGNANMGNAGMSSGGGGIIY